jgi:hypothetical protein
MRIIPFVTGPSYHDHHHSHNIGNFAGSCYLWDLMLDTNVPYMNDFLKNWFEKSDVKATIISIILQHRYIKEYYKKMDLVFSYWLIYIVYQFYNFNAFSIILIKPI